MQDADRIVYSAPFRRLANKTQVHPLYDHDHIHHRLIHSVETASAGRSLGMAVGHWLEEEGEIQFGERHKLAGIVHAACLAHDIGNPPFGHSGEASMGHWFSGKFSTPNGVFGGMDSSLRAEFKEFEGNAQGFRILTRLEMYRNEGGMRLSNAVLGAFTKYPVTADVQSKLKGRVSYCGLKKFGVFDGEAEYFPRVAKTLGLIEETGQDGTWWRRHPLVFLVEAADDICYNIVDIEDGYTAGDLEYSEVINCLEPLGGRSNREHKEYTKFEKIAYLRAKSIGVAIEACVDAFKENYDAIMQGTFSGSLVEVSSKKDEFQKIRRIAQDKLFTAPRKTELEVHGRNVIHRILEGILPVYQKLADTGWEQSRLEGYELQLVRATNLDLRGVHNSYTAFHSLTDFVSGMTDRYAVDVARMVSGN
ncbi:dGTP triphosphohydrolase [Phaeobacter gallaeciensis]|uniref:dGTP triphosphohydrolase n=1 Tax=Phaeobacter gallaeciensis TaxID=60890 RepID=UPI00215DB382|nr:dNTP triphosphohydrolase [Phaeobacter gallaeciensis]